MAKPATSETEVREIIKMRQLGYSMPEISRLMGRSKTTVFRYVRNVKVISPYLEILKQKQGGSKMREKAGWTLAKQKANEYISRLDQKDKILILASLYWGEGNKRELNLINSDPDLIKVFVLCLEEIGVHPQSIKFTLRIYQDIDRKTALKYWSKILGISPDRISNINVLEGKKLGKLKYGMCRVRVAKSASYFKLIMSLIEKIKENINAAVVQRIERRTPKP